MENYRIIQEKCPRFNNCSTNLCPYDPHLEDRIWYPDEDICRRWSITKDSLWIKTQRKIKKKSEDSNKYWTVPMLKQLFAVKKGVSGLSPDVAEKPQLNKFLKGYKKREFTEEQKEVLRKRLRKIQEARQLTFQLED